MIELALPYSKSYCNTIEIMQLIHYITTIKPQNSIYRQETRPTILFNSIIINCISLIFYRGRFDIKHWIGGKSQHLNLYPISGYVYNLGEAYHELLEFTLVNIKLHNKVISQMLNMRNNLIWIN